MKITKDEASILWKALREQKYELNDRVVAYARIKGISSMAAFERLEEKLSKFSKDQRRTGRTSQDSFYDVLKRFVSRGHSSKS